MAKRGRGQPKLTTPSPRSLREKPKQLTKPGGFAPVPFTTDPAEVERLCRTGIPGYDPWRDGAGYVFHVEQAVKVLRFFWEELVHVKGALAGRGFVLEPWEVAILGNLFGWLDSDGLRRYRTCLVYVPRKAGKTPIGAGIVNYMLFEDGEPGAEVYGAASTFKEAKMVWSHASNMVKRNPRLNERARVYKGMSAGIALIEHPENIDDIGMYRLLTSDVEHGHNTHAAIVDELHNHDNSDLVDEIESSTSGRLQPLVVYLTTADFERPESVCNAKHDYATRVRNGMADPTFLPVIYEATREEVAGTFRGVCPLDGTEKDLPNWADPELWARVNPNLGVSKTRKYMHAQIRKALEAPAYVNTLLRLDLNVRTEQDTKAISMDQWDACDGMVDPAALKGRWCFAGLDLASRQDIAAWVLLFPPLKKGDPWVVLPRLFTPLTKATARETRERILYLTWGRQGYLTIIDGDVIETAVVRQQILDDGKEFDIQGIAGDRWNLESLRQQLDIEGVEIHEFGQGFRSMSEPTKELLYKILPTGALAHGGNPVLRWMALNAALEEDSAGNIKFNKKKSGDKIDGLIGLVMALGLAMTIAPKGRPYKNRGVRVVGG